MFPGLVRGGNRERGLQRTSERGCRIIDEREILSANKEYFERIADDYEDLKDPSMRALIGRNAQRRVEAAVRRMAWETDGEVLLDIGCGTGNVLKFSRHEFEISIGLDISFSMLARAQKHSRKLVVSDAACLPFKDNCISGVTAVSVLHHVCNTPRLMEEVFRVLKDGGTFFSDHDPNQMYFDLTNNSFIVTSARRLFSGLASSSKQTIGPGGAGSLVEYHWSITGGMSATGIRALLESIGFREVRVIHHSDSSSLERPRSGPWLEKMKELLVRILCLERRYEHVSRIFAVIARKDRGK